MSPSVWVYTLNLARVQFEGPSLQLPLFEVLHILPARGQRGTRVTYGIDSAGACCSAFLRLGPEPASLEAEVYTPVYNTKGHPGKVVQFRRVAMRCLRVQLAPSGVRLTSDGAGFDKECLAFCLVLYTLEKPRGRNIIPTSITALNPGNN